MNLKKRGLGRGLEALLAEGSGQEEVQQSAKTACPEQAQPASAEEQGKQAAMVVKFFKSIQKEHHALLEEAEDLKKLLEEFELHVKQE